MINTDELCMSCMREIGDEKQCPYCGFHADSPQIAPYLPVRSTIANRYLVGKLIEYNGDGASYMAWDLSAKTAVVIREFMPDAIATREAGKTEVTPMPGKEDIYHDCLQSFTEMWRKLMRLTGLSALVEVFGIIEENNTAYAIQEYVGGITLREYLLRTPTGYISWDKARPLFMPILSTLGNLHTSGIIHRGISPTTLVLAPDGKLRITGFSINRVRSAKSELTPQIFNGYAAIEQYGFDGQQGPWTDIYSFAAVLYRALIGSDPIEAVKRATNDKLMIPGKFAEQLPAYVINGLINALQIYPEDRTRNVEQCRAELSAAPSAAVQWDDNPTQLLPRESSKVPSDFLDGKDDTDDYSSAKGEKKENKKTALIVIISLLVVIAALVIGITALNSDGEEETTNPDISADDSGYVEVPELKGWLYTDRQSQLGAIFNFSLKYEFSEEYEEGQIISQYPESGTKVKKGSTISVIVSKGPKSIKLINVVGLQYEEAKSKLEEIGFTVVKATKPIPNDGSHAENSVYRMSPSNFDGEYSKGDEVMLEVWAEITTTPETPEETEENNNEGDNGLFPDFGW